MSRRQAIIGGQGDGLKCLLCFALAVVCTAAVAALCHLWRLQTPAQLHNGTQQSRSCPKGRPGRGEGTFVVLAALEGTSAFDSLCSSICARAPWQPVFKSIPFGHPLYIHRIDAGAILAMHCSLAGCSSPIARHPFLSARAASSALHRPSYGCAQQIAASAASAPQRYLRRQHRTWCRQRRSRRTAGSHTSYRRAAASCCSCARAAAAAAGCEDASSWRCQCHDASTAAAVACRGACAGGWCQQRGSIPVAVAVGFRRQRRGELRRVLTGRTSAVAVTRPGIVLTRT